jgi:peptide/nickel transport system substrate-binding protein
VRGRRLKVAVALAVVLGTSALVSTATGGGTATTTFVFGTEADATLLDPSLVSDGPSLRPTDQIFESLVGFKLGGTAVVPELATSWQASKNGLNWTFNLRRGVKFSDGTRFNAASVCFNFNRWFNFPAPLQSDALSYYWITVFQGFKNPASGNPGPDKALYKGCKANGQYKVTLMLTRPSTSFLAAIGLPNFGIASPAALQKYQADAGTVDSTGVFHPTGSFATQNPIGTGPYKLKSWSVGNRLELEANPLYWGPKPKIKRVILRPIGDTAARLQALQTGEVQGIDGVNPADFGTVRSNSKLVLKTRPVFSVGYIGINQAMPPFDKLPVRQALAYSIDRVTVAKAFYGGIGAPANQFLPPALFGNAKKGVPAYPYNPDKAKQLLQQAGLSLPVKVDFWYPTNVSRPYMPDPQRNFQAFQASMEKSGFSVTPHSAPWRPDYRGTVSVGKAQLYMLGWIADFGDPANFLNVHFGTHTDQFGFTNQALFTELAKADAESNTEKRTRLYEQASIDVMKFLPMIPYVWAGSAIALDKSVKGYVTGPIGPTNEPYARLSISG